MQAFSDLIEFNIALLLSGFVALVLAWLMLWLVFREINKRVQDLHAGGLAIVRRCEVLISESETKSPKFK